MAAGFYGPKCLLPVFDFPRFSTRRLDNVSDFSELE